MKRDKPQEAIRLANATPFGLASYFYYFNAQDAWSTTACRFSAFGSAISTL